MATTRRGDFTHKEYLYKFYDKGFNHKRRDYLTAEQYMSFDLTGAGDAVGNADILADATGDSLYIEGTGDSNVGLSATPYLTSDPTNPAKIKSSYLQFRWEFNEDTPDIINQFYIKFFDYTLLFNVGWGMTHFTGLYYKLGTPDQEGIDGTVGGIFIPGTYFRAYEENDTMYFQYSSNGSTWFDFGEWDIDYDTDNTENGQLALGVWFGIAIAESASVNIYDIEWLRKDGGFKGIIGNSTVIDDLQFTENINEPATSTTLKLKQDPVTLPDYIVNGAFVDIYANYWGYLSYGQVGTILDENLLPIEDENDQPVTGLYTEDLTPEQDSWIRFSGYVDSIELDYDAEEVTLGLVSHGEEMANILAIPNALTAVNIISQTSQNASESITVPSYNRRQTFTLDRVQRISGIVLRVVSGSVADYPTIVLGQGTTDIAEATSRVSTSAGEYEFNFSSDIELEAGTYWFAINSSAGGITWYYQNTDVYDGGSRQTRSGSVWSNTTTDFYFRLIFNTTDVTTEYTSETLSDIITDLVEGDVSLETDGALKRANSQITLGTVDDIGYSLSLLLKLNTVKDAIDRVYEQTTLGWWWSIDTGTSELSMREPSDEPEHVFYVGKDILELKIKKAITELKNDVIFVGGDINEEQDTLTIRTQDIDSIGTLRRGLSILSDGRVLRYDTAQAFSDFEIAQNNGELITTDIEVQAKTYDIETIRVGDMVRIVNLGGTSILLQIAGLNYSPLSVTLSLSNVPNNILKNLSSTQRSLDNLLTLEADNAI